MFLLFLIFVLAAAWGGRSLSLRYASCISAATAVPAAIVVAALAGYFFSPTAFRTEDIAPVGGATAASTPKPYGPSLRRHLTPPEVAALAQQPAAADGNVDGFNSGSHQVVFGRGQVPVLSRKLAGSVFGWIVDDSHAAGSSIVAVFDGRRRVDETPGYGLLRQDVAQYLKNDDAKYSGFEFALPLALLAPGGHTVSIGVVDAGSRTMRTLQPAAQFVVQP